MSETGEYSFVKKYLASFDSKREELSKFFGKDAYFVWNGNTFQGSAEIIKFLMTLPFSKHVLHLLDVQPINFTEVEARDHVLVVAGGKVTFNETQTYEFKRNMIVKKVNGKFIIINMSVYLSD